MRDNLVPAKLVVVLNAPLIRRKKLVLARFHALSVQLAQDLMFVFLLVTWIFLSFVDTFHGLFDFGCSQI